LPNSLQRISSPSSTASPSTASPQTPYTPAKSYSSLSMLRPIATKVRNQPSSELKKNCAPMEKRHRGPSPPPFSPSFSYPFQRHLYSYLKPESIRVHPEATVRPWAIVEVEGDAVGFASALGYTCVLPIHSSFTPHSFIQYITASEIRSTNVAIPSARVLSSS